MKQRKNDNSFMSVKSHFRISLALIYILSAPLFGKEIVGSVPLVRNLAPEFLIYWDKVKNKSIKDKVATFKSDVMLGYPAFYKFKIAKWKAIGKDPDTELRKELTDFPKIEKGFREKTAAISGEIDRHLATFVRASTWWV